MSVTIPVYDLRIVRTTSFRTEAKQINGPEDAAAILSGYLADADRERFVVITLDAKHRVTGLHTAAIGTLDRVEIHPRDVFKIAVRLNAAAIIVGHNHPSGDVTPSEEDARLTRRVFDAGILLGIPLLDHLIVGDGDDYVSYQSTPTRFPGVRAAESR